MTRFFKQDVACPVCGSWKAAVLYDPSVEVDDPVKLYGAASGVRGTQRLVKCGCGMIYENPRYPDDVILKGYAEAEDEHDSQHHMRVRSFLWALKRLGTRIPGRGARVLWFEPI